MTSDTAARLAKLAMSYARLHTAYTETEDEQQAETLAESMSDTYQAAMLIATKDEFMKAVAKAAKELKR